MVIAKTKIHIICGVCGCNEMLKYKIVPDAWGDEDGEYPGVQISCENCATLTGLDEVMREEY